MLHAQEGGASCHQNKELGKSCEGHSGLGSCSLAMHSRSAWQEAPWLGIGPTKGRVQATPALGGWSMSRQHVQWDKASEFWKQGQCGRMISFAWLAKVCCPPLGLLPFCSLLAFNNLNIPAGLALLQDRVEIVRLKQSFKGKHISSDWR